jgi:proteasome lid subunit RPN8/RPN11
MSDAKFGSWSVAESPVTVEYSLVAIEEIRRAVAEGFQKLSRGGVEVGGVLYGSRDGRTINVQAMRPIECEHARGPAFVLSEHDRELLEEQIRRDLADARMDGMICVGWFLSHTRTEIMLSESDLKIYSTFFGAPWQVTLVIRPGRGGSMRAGFFVREPDGTVKSESSYQEFNFPDRLAGVLDRPARSERTHAERLPPPSFAWAGDASAPTMPAQPELPPARPAQPRAEPLAAPQFLPPAPRRSKWPWLVGWLVLVAGLVIGAMRFFIFAPHVEPISLSLSERDGVLQIQWNGAAKAVAKAATGSLAIFDGKDARTVDLKPQDLASGKFAYKRSSGDVEVRLTVAGAGGEKLGEQASRFLDPTPIKPPGDSDELKTLQQQRDELQAEVDRLTRENAAQDQRVQELDRTLRILQARMGTK